jgi:hypothetical protein
MAANASYGLPGRYGTAQQRASLKTLIAVLGYHPDMSDDLKRFGEDRVAEIRTKIKAAPANKSM